MTNVSFPTFCKNSSKVTPRFSNSANQNLVNFRISASLSWVRNLSMELTVPCAVVSLSILVNVEICLPQIVKLFEKNYSFHFNSKLIKIRNTIQFPYLLTKLYVSITIPNSHWFLRKLFLSVIFLSCV